MSRGSSNWAGRVSEKTDPRPSSLSAVMSPPMSAGLQWFMVGEAKCWLIEAARMYDEAKHLMKRGITIYTNMSGTNSTRISQIDDDF